MGAEPRAERMPWPGYEPERPGAGLLPWSWALERLERSRRYWLATARADGSPHVMPVWAAWHEGALVFSTGAGTRKARNLRARPRCSVAIGDGAEAVVVEGVGEELSDPAALGRADAAYAAKYGSSMLLPDSPVFAIRPRVVTGVVESEGGPLPTRWRLD